MGLYNCTLILTQEEFVFWSFWLSILVSPIPSVRSLASWSLATGVQLQPSGDDYIQLASYYGRYTVLVNVRYQVSNDEFNTQQRNNILQITGNAQVPPTVVYQVRDSNDLLVSLTNASSSSAEQHGQYIILTNNLTLSFAPAGGMPVSYPTTITTWPSSTVALDFQLAQNAFQLADSVALKNIVLLNLGPGGPDAEGYASLTSGLWAFNVSSWRTRDQQLISLESVAMVVPQQEVDFYFTCVTKPDSTSTSHWISAFSVESYDTVNSTWVYFSSLATGRFTAQNVNITSSVPQAFDVTITLPGTGDVISSPSSSASGGTDRRDILLFALLAITLPTAVGAALLTYVLLKRRRLRQMCIRDDAANTKEPKRDSVDVPEQRRGTGGGDCEDGRASSTDLACCLRLPLPLRRSKFVNPLYEEPGAAAQEVVLTELLGPRRLAPAPALGSGARLGLFGSVDAPTPTTAASGAYGPWDQADAADGPQDLEQGVGEARPQSIVLDLEVMGQPSRERSTALPSAARPASASLQLLASEGVASSAPSDGERRSLGQRSAAAEPAALVSADGGVATALLPLLPIVPAATAAGGAGGFPEAQAGRCPSPSGACAASAAAADADADARAAGLQRIGGDARPPGAGPGPLDMQRLEQLRREIGDRHLEVQHSLGWGGCAVVYKGTWKGLQVAVKTLLVQGDSKQSRQFLTEAAISASLQHTNIVTTYLYELRPLDEVDLRKGSSEELRLHSSEGSSDGEGAPRLEPRSCWKLYIVQEYCELGTLKAAIDQGYFKGTRGGQPNMAFLLRVATDVSLGLTHVHSKDVVHGDVTVSNVLLQKDPSRPQGCVAKIADFGLSSKLEPGQPHHSQMYGGTPHYMAPERTRGMLSKPCDIYSLGVCLWELYCGTPPWRRHAGGAHNRRYGGELDSFGSNTDSGSNAHLPWVEQQRQSNDSGGGAESFRFPRSCLPEYAALVRTCLSSDPQRRPTASAVTAALQGMLRRYE